jgi:hypothetical protein
MAKHKHGDFVSASELAQMGYCERQVGFDAKWGAPMDEKRRQSQMRGSDAHNVFYQESLRLARASEKKGRCFVATLAMGECEETRALRAFRDLYLRRYFAGRWVIGAYYRKSPQLCDWMKGRPRALKVVRVALGWIARLARVAVTRKVGRL